VIDAHVREYAGHGGDKDVERCELISSCVAVSSLLEQALVFCFNSACIFAIESPIRKKFAIHELVGARKILFFLKT
jgi:hypothetical protein